MIVLDEQLVSYGVQASIARWYRGTVTDITRLRSDAVVLDKAIPMLLQDAGSSHWPVMAYRVPRPKKILWPACHQLAV